MQCDTAGPKVSIKVLSFNLFWWSLFKERGGGEAGHLIAINEQGVPFDFMGFQECDSVTQVLQLSGLLGEFSHIQGEHALGLAYRREAWELLANRTEDIAEDSQVQWYGTRGGLWARFRHKVAGKTVFFVNHHGPLPVNSGGLCGCEATAFGLLKLIRTRAEPKDAVVLVGDFNADINSATVKLMSQRMHRVISGVAFGGVDHIFSNCGTTSLVENAHLLGSGGSDHDAVEATLDI